jgi:hypothetical protein
MTNTSTTPTTMRTKTRAMTTDHVEPTNPDSRAVKALRARTLTDPLGAKGHRRTQDRTLREGKARRLLFVATLVGFVGSLGAAVTGRIEPKPAALTDSGQRIVMEVPVTDGQGGIQTIVRYVVPEDPPDARTRSTP